jgi:hypothetical protein
MCGGGIFGITTYEIACGDIWEKENRLRRIENTISKTFNNN